MKRKCVMNDVVDFVISNMKGRSSVDVHLSLNAMNILSNIRPVFRATALRRRAPHSHLAPSTLVRLQLQPSHIFRPAKAFQQQRGEASMVSGRPASQTISQATVNVREEVGNSASDWAKVIAGGNFTEDAVKTDRRTFVSGCLDKKAFRLSWRFFG
jgi:hypothetical protein